MVVLGYLMFSGQFIRDAHVNDWLLDGLTGTALYVAGFVERYRRPSKTLIGDVLIVAGLLWFSEDLITIYSVPTKTLGTLLREAPTPVFVWLVLAYPSGKLRTFLQKALVAAICVASWIVTSIYSTIYTGPTPDKDQDQALLRFHASEATQDLIGNIATGIEIVVTVLVAGVLIVQLVQAQPARRLVVLPVYVGSLIASLLSGIFSVAYILPIHISGAARGGLHVVSGISVLFLPAGFLIASLRLELDRSRLASLLSVDTSLSPEVMQDELRNAVHDPALQLVGSAGEEPPQGAGRTIVPVTAGGQRLGWVDVDAVLQESGTMLDTLVAIASACLRHDALTRSAAEHVAELQANRTEMDAAVDQARRQVERDLHDGAQQSLLAATLALRRALVVPTAERDGLLRDVDVQLQASLSELRELSRGLVPPLLAERGLASALLSLRDRSPIAMEVSGLSTERLPDWVERALYFMVAECLTNSVKHAHARSVDVHVAVAADAVTVSVRDDGAGSAKFTPGGGLMGLKERLAAIGGDLTLESRAGSGTTVTGCVPLTAKITPTERLEPAADQSVQ